MKKNSDRITLQPGGQTPKQPSLGLAWDNPAGAAKAGPAAQVPAQAPAPKPEPAPQSPVAPAPAAPPAVKGQPVTPREDAAAGTATAAVAPAPALPPGATVIKIGNMSVGFGQALLEARGAANLSVAQVSQKTLVPKDFIEAAENENLNLLPSPLYTRSHLKKLCALYGMDSEPVLQDYQRRQQEDGAQPEATDNRFIIAGGAGDKEQKVCYRMRGQETGQEQAAGAEITRILVGAAMILVLVLVVASMLIQHLRNRRPAARQPTAAEQTVRPLPLMPIPGRGPAATVTAPGQQPAGDLDMSKFIVPQQLPLQELPIPEN